MTVIEGDGRFKVRASFPTPGGFGTCAGEYILVERDHEYHPFVTWWRNLDSGGNHVGHYFETYEEAARDFGERIMTSFPERVA